MELTQDNKKRNDKREWVDLRKINDSHFNWPHFRGKNFRISKDKLNFQQSYLFNIGMYAMRKRVNFGSCSEHEIGIFMPLLLFLHHHIYHRFCEMKLNNRKWMKLKHQLSANRWEQTRVAKQEMKFIWIISIDLFIFFFLLVFSL